MTDNFEKLTRAEVERADKARELLGRNRDAGRVMDYIGSCGGYDGNTQKKAVSRMLYIDEPPISQPNRQERQLDRGETHGSGRWERLRRGNASFHIIEAKFIHNGLIKTHGEAWAGAFKPDELVKLSFYDFLTKAATFGLPWPEETAPAVALEIIWQTQKERSLSIRPADPSASRLGGSVGSKNRQLQSTNSLPKHEPQEQYHLQVRGVKPGVERLFVFEASQEDLAFDGGNEPCCGFPVRLLKPKSANVTIKAEDNGSFEFYDIKGGFAFFAVAFPDEWDFQEVFNADPNGERWSRAEFEDFIRSVRRLQHENPSDMRLGWYGYKVA